jgi:hypothetical protein
MSLPDYHGFRGALFLTGADASSVKPELLLFQGVDSAEKSALKRRSPGPETPGNHRLSLGFSGLEDLLPEIRDNQQNSSTLCLRSGPRRQRQSLTTFEGFDPGSE